MNLIRYVIDFFHINGAGQQSVKYAKGQTYPESDETISHVEAGHAEIIVVDVSGTTEATDAEAAPQPDNNVEQGSPAVIAGAPVQNETTPVAPAVTDTPAVTDATAVSDTTNSTDATATIAQPQPDLTQTITTTDPASVVAPLAQTLPAVDATPTVTVADPDQAGQS